jgi:hypothetical protein
MSGGDGFVKKETHKEETSGNPSCTKKESPRERGGFLAQQLSYEAYGVTVAVSVAPA